MGADSGAATASRVVGFRGVAARIRGAPDLLAGLCGQLPAFFDDAGQVALDVAIRRVGDTVTVELPDDLSVNGIDGEEILRAGASRVELALAERQPDRVAVHAGVVALGGLAVILPGRSGAGKSTLVRELLRAGGSYLSDEFALFDADGLVHPYPRRLTMREPTGSRRYDPEAYGARPAAGAVAVGVLAFLRYDAQAGWQTETLSPGQAVLALLDNCLCARRSPARALQALSAVATGTPALRGTRGPAEQTAARLAQLCTAPRRDPDARRPAPGGPAVPSPHPQEDP